MAAFAEILRQSPHVKSWTLASVEAVARAASNQSPEHAELLSLIERAKKLMPERSASKIVAGG